MLEILIAAGAGVAVFVCLLLALAIKNPTLKKPPHIHTCARCNCGKQDHRHALPAGQPPQDQSRK